MSAWAIEDRDGRVLADFKCASRLDVGRKLVPDRFDAFRLHVSSSYREIFDRAVEQVLEREGWRIVRVSRRRAAAGNATSASHVTPWSDRDGPTAAI